MSGAGYQTTIATGHGSSAPWHHPFSLRDCAEAADQVISQLDLDAAVDWVGSAWGGHVGNVFAASHPDRIRSLVTIGTPVQALTSAERQNIAPVDKAEAAARLLPHGGTTVIAGAGHLAPLLQSPRELAEVITTFWSSVVVPENQSTDA
jgi:pimeloyl-ACP methyl ester carboxylesterase